MTTKTFKNPGDKVLGEVVVELLEKYPTMSATAIRNYVENNRGWRIGTQQVAYHRTAWLARRREAEKDRRVTEMLGTGVIRPALVDVQVQGIEQYQKVVVGKDLRDPVERQQKRVEDWALEHPTGTIVEMDADIGKLIPDVLPAFALDALRIAREAFVAEQTPPAVEEKPMPEKKTKLGRGHRRDDRDEAILALLVSNPHLVPSPSDFGKGLPNVEALRQLTKASGFKFQDRKNGGWLTTEDVKVTLRRLHKAERLPARTRAPVPEPSVPVVVPSPEQLKAIGEKLVAEVANHPNWGTDRDRTTAPVADGMVSITLPDGTRIEASAADALLLVKGLKGAP